MGAIGGLDEAVLVGVKTALAHRDTVLILTDPSPAVHLHHDGGHEQWGTQGGGPAELEGPVAMEWSGDRVFVLDQNQHKLVVFGIDGSFRSSRDLGGVWANRIFVVQGDTLLGTFVPMSEERAVVRLRGASADTLLEYRRPESRLRLTAPGAPSWTATQPFTAVDRWTVLPDAAVAHWDRRTGVLRFIDFAGVEVASIRVPPPEFPVTAADREHWVQTSIPSEFMGQRVFEPLRPVAREQAEFPEHFPPVMDLLPDPSGAVWVKRRITSSGEHWILLDRTGAELGALTLPVGEELLHVGADELLVRAVDELGVESVVRYRRP